MHSVYEILDTYLILPQPLSTQPRMSFCFSNEWANCLVLVRRSRYLRNADRKKNSLKYPELDYPEIYLLHGGYSNFYKNYKELCEPRNYVPMNDPKYSTELRALRARSKSWACTGDSRSSYFKRL